MSEQQVNAANAVLEITSADQDTKDMLLAKIAEMQALLARAVEITNTNVDVVDGSTPSSSVDAAAGQSNINDTADSPFGSSS